MKRVCRFLRLPSSDRRLLFSTALLVWAVRLGLWLLPFRTLRRLLAKPAQKMAQAREADPTEIKRVVWAVETVSRYVPAATCLTRALVTHVLLTQRGCVALLRIGVAKTETGQLDAHAWIERQGKVIIGGMNDLSRYTLLPPLQ